MNAKRMAMLFWHGLIAPAEVERLLAETGVPLAEFLRAVMVFRAADADRALDDMLVALGDEL